MLAVILGLTGAVVYGVSDFAGGMGAKHLGALRLTWLSILAAAAAVLLAFYAMGADWSLATWPTIFWGGLSGIFGSIAIMFLYASLAIGPMSIVSPLGALVSAVVPVVWEIFFGKVLTPLGYVAIVIALVAVALVGFVPEKGAVKLNPRGLLFATFAGIGIGGYLICMSNTPAASGFTPFIFNRAVAFAVLSLLLLGTWLVKLAHSRGIFGRDGAPRADVVVGEKGSVNWKAGLWFAVVCGVLDTVGNILILTGMRTGNLSVMAVLAALYPAGTIILATIVLKERIARVQAIGLVLALIAAAMLSLS